VIRRARLASCRRQSSNMKSFIITLVCVNSQFNSLFKYNLIVLLVIILASFFPISPPFTFHHFFKQGKNHKFSVVCSFLLYGSVVRCPTALLRLKGKCLHPRKSQNVVHFVDLACTFLALEEDWCEKPNTHIFCFQPTTCYL
jgi:hypothetical protein